MTGIVPRITKRASTPNLANIKSSNDNSSAAFADILDQDATYSVNRIIIASNTTLPFQTNPTASKHLTVLSGTMHITLGEDVFVLVEDESLYVPQGVLYGLENRADTTAVIISLDFFGS